MLAKGNRESRCTALMTIGSRFWKASGEPAYLRVRNLVLTSVQTNKLAKISRRVFLTLGGTIVLSVRLAMKLMLTMRSELLFSGDKSWAGPVRSGIP